MILKIYKKFSKKFHCNGDEKSRNGGIRKSLSLNETEKSRKKVGKSAETLSKGVEFPAQVK